MRKRELLNQNSNLLSEVNGLKQENGELTKALKDAQEEIKALKNRIKELEKALEDTKAKAEPEAEAEITEEALEEQNIFNYGAVIIGKVLISATEYVGRIDTDGNERAEAAKAEIFERAEETKAEILDIISSDNSYNSKNQLMERVYHSAVSFFDRTASRL